MSQGPPNYGGSLSIARVKHYATTQGKNYPRTGNNLPDGHIQYTVLPI